MQILKHLLQKTLVTALLLWISISGIGCKKDEYKNLDCSTIQATYLATIKPIIDANCLTAGCHNAGSPNGSYTTYEGLLVRVNNGTLAKRVLYSKDMPRNGILSLQDRQKIKCWIDSGAPKN